MRANITRGAGAGGGNCDVRGLSFEQKKCADGFSRTPLGFSGALAASTNTTLTVEPQRAFLPLRLVVPSRFDGDDVAVADIKIGNRSQSVADGDMPIEAFSEVAIDSCLWFETAAAATKIQLVLNNKTPAIIAFESAMFGYSVD